MTGPKQSHTELLVEESEGNLPSIDDILASKLRSSHTKTTIQNTTTNTTTNTPADKKSTPSNKSVGRQKGSSSTTAKHDSGKV